MNNAGVATAKPERCGEAKQPPKSTASWTWTSIHQQYKTIEILGQGTYGVVYKAEDKVTGEIVALKRCRLDVLKDFGIPETTLREIALLRDLRHQNIMRLYGLSCNTERLYMICEFLDLDLKKYLRKNSQGLPIRKVKEVTYEILKGLAFCHGHRVIHRDLKPHNVLISPDATQVKIADFGLARASFVPGKTLTHEVITLWYRAPELLLGHCNYTMGVDVWSAGCIVAEILSGRPLFVGDSEIDTLFKIFRVLGTPKKDDWPSHAVVRWDQFPVFEHKPTPFRSLSAELTEAGEHFLSKIFQFNPADRPSAIELLHHPWLSEVHVLQDEDADLLQPEWKKHQTVMGTAPWTDASTISSDELEDLKTADESLGDELLPDIDTPARVPMVGTREPTSHQVPPMQQQLLQQQPIQLSPTEQPMAPPCHHNRMTTIPTTQGVSQQVTPATTDVVPPPLSSSVVVPHVLHRRIPDPQPPPPQPHRPTTTSQHAMASSRDGNLFHHYGGRYRRPAIPNHEEHHHGMMAAGRRQKDQIMHDDDRHPSCLGQRRRPPPPHHCDDGREPHTDAAGGRRFLPARHTVAMYGRRSMTEHNHPSDAPPPPAAAAQPPPPPSSACLKSIDGGPPRFARPVLARRRHSSIVLTPVDDAQPTTARCHQNNHPSSSYRPHAYCLGEIQQIGRRLSISSKITHTHDDVRRTNLPAPDPPIHTTGADSRYWVAPLPPAVSASVDDDIEWEIGCFEPTTDHRSLHERQSTLF